MEVSLQELQVLIANQQIRIHRLEGSILAMEQQLKESQEQLAKRGGPIEAQTADNVRDIHGV